MVLHQYLAEEALQLVMRKIRDRDVTLATTVQEAIDAGKEVLERDALRKRGAPRTYRLVTRLTHEEALATALKSLGAYFVEHPRCVNSLIKELAGAAVATEERGTRRLFDVDEPRRPVVQDERVQRPSADVEEFEQRASLEGIGIDKVAMIELRTETQVTATQAPEYYALTPTADQLIAEQEQNLDRLRELVDFTRT